MNSTSKYCFNALFVFVILFGSSSMNHAFFLSSNTPLHVKTCTTVVACLDQFIKMPTLWKKSIDEIIVAVKADATYKKDAATQAFVEALEDAKKCLNKTALKACLDKHKAFLEEIVKKECGNAPLRAKGIQKNFPKAIDSIVL